MTASGAYYAAKYIYSVHKAINNEHCDTAYTF